MTIEEYNNVCRYLRSVIRGTTWEGNVYTVGGCLRDLLMGHDINDIDLAVTMPDGGVMFALWLEQKGLTLGEPVLYPRFSTSKLRLKAFPDDEIEVVQTRSEQYTDANSRNPEVCFGTLEEDCFRRDLTINSLYQDISTGRIIDITGRGVEDINAHRIRTPMAPEETFSDDPIRILRAIRFAVRFNWPLSRTLIEAMKANAHRMKIVRRTRLAHEFEKALLGPDPVNVMKLLKETGVIYRILPEMEYLFRKKVTDTRGPHEKHLKLPSLWDMALRRLAETPPVLSERYAALFKDFDKVKVSYSEPKVKKAGPFRRRPRGRGRNAVVQTALKRLHCEPALISEVKKLL